MYIPNFKTKIAHPFLALAISSTLLALGGCNEEAIQTLPERNWQLVWSDDFNGDASSAPDASKWTYDIGSGGWGNQELQYYTDRTENVAQDGNGNLVITAIAGNYGGAPYTSGRIKTQGLFSQTYGRFEARIKTPSGPGIWPAFWLLGDGISTEGWPQCGEIDIMEQRGNEPAIANGSMHGPGYSGAGAMTKSYALPSGARFDTDYHIYAVEWGSDFVDYFVDGYLYQRITPKDVSGEWVFDQPFFIILNVAVGGNYVGYPTSGTGFPQSMLIDYVKVYKQL
jgi:beta-glucanase (GH16 family)